MWYLQVTWYLQNRFELQYLKVELLDGVIVLIFAECEGVDVHPTIVIKLYYLIIFKSLIYSLKHMIYMNIKYIQ